MRRASLFSYGKTTYHYLVNIVNITILSLNFLSKTILPYPLGPLSKKRLSLSYSCTHTCMYKNTHTKLHIWTHKHKQMQVSLTYIHRMYTQPYFYHHARVHRDIRAKQLCLLSNWEENNSSSSKRFSIFFSFARCSARRGLVPLWVMSQCVQPHCIKKHELATLFTDTHFVAWHCQTIFPLHLPSTTTHPPTTVRFSVKPLTWPVINFKRLNGMKSNYTAHVSAVRQLARLQFERWAPQWLQSIDLELCQL